MLATFLDESMDVYARVKSLRHYLESDPRNRIRKILREELFEQTSVAASVELLCRHFGLKSTPRIEKNLREAVILMSNSRKLEIDREIEDLKEKRDRILQSEK